VVYISHQIHRNRHKTVTFDSIQKCGYKYLSVRYKRLNIVMHFFYRIGDYDIRKELVLLATIIGFKLL